MPLWSTLAMLVAATLAASVWLAAVWQQRSLAALIKLVEARAKSRQPENANARNIDNLPPPVARYLNHVLPPESRNIRLVRYEQVGTLRVDPTSERWMNFSASQVIAPTASAFVWDARVGVMPLIHVRVRDSFVNGVGSGQVALLSAIPIGSASGNMEMNSGSLHRFLAEAVWYPTALLPSASLRWDAIDDSRACATLTQGAVTVSLEFRFNSANEVSSIYTPGRWGSFDGGYKQVPWEGRFGDYAKNGGVRVPTRGEVGWYFGGEWLAVWRGYVAVAQRE